MEHHADHVFTFTRGISITLMYVLYDNEQLYKFLYVFTHAWSFFLSFFFFLEKKMGKEGNLSWRLPSKCDHNNTLSVGPEPAGARTPNEPYLCTQPHPDESCLIHLVKQCLHMHVHACHDAHIWGEQFVMVDNHFEIKYMLTSERERGCSLCGE